MSAFLHDSLKPGDTLEVAPPDGRFFVKLDPDKRRAAELILSQQAFSRPYIAAPGTPADRLEILRAAFMRSLADAELVAEFGKINITNKPTPGAELQKLVEQVYASPSQIVALARAAQKPPAAAPAK